MGIHNQLTMFVDSHVIRAIYEFSYETIETTGPLMVLTMKLTTFAWNVWDHDGRRPTEVCGSLYNRVTNQLTLFSKGFG